MWIIDFGLDMPETEAALYEAPFERVRAVVRPKMISSPSEPRAASAWWLHQRPRPDLRAAIFGLRQYVATVRHSKHRLLTWLPAGTVPDSALVVFARDDDFTFGVLHSRVHELWALAMGTQLETRPRYTPTTCFETFPFPHPTPEQREAIASAARELDRLRRGWLDPEGWSEEQKKARTLTNLYNQRPAWLADVHARLDRAVLDASGWPHDLTDDEILARLLDLNLSRASTAETLAGDPAGLSGEASATPSED